MAKNRPKKQVVWKDTFDFKCFPKYEYTRLQKTRLLLFQGRAEKYRALINYADSFEDNSKIALIYMLGYNKGIKKYVEKTEHNVVVLCARIPDEVMAGYDEYWGLMEKLEKVGMAKDGIVSDYYFKNRANVYAYYGEDSDDEIVATYKADQEVLESYPEICRRINACYERYTIIDKLHPEKTISHKDLNKIIKRYFPVGREECGIPQNTKNTASICQKAIEAGAARSDPVEALKIPDDEAHRKLISRNIKRCIMDINTDLRETGKCNIQDVWNKMTRPPYGWQKNDVHSCYCFSYALSEYLDEEYYIYDSVYAFRYKDAVAFLRDGMLLNNSLSRRIDRYGIMLFSNTGWHVMNRLAFIFDVQTCDNLVVMVGELRIKLRGFTRFPVTLIDEYLGRVFCTDDKNLFDVSYLKTLEKHFTWDKCSYIKEKLTTFNDDVVSWIHKHFPNLYDDEILACTTTDSSWLWSVKTFVETLETNNAVPPWTSTYYDLGKENSVTFIKTRFYVQRELENNIQIKPLYLEAG